jgi:hypothetical protein
MESATFVLRHILFRRVSNKEMGDALSHNKPLPSAAHVNQFLFYGHFYEQEDGVPMHSLLIFYHNKLL